MSTSARASELEAYRPSGNGHGPIYAKYLDRIKFTTSVRERISRPGVGTKRELAELAL